MPTRHVYCLFESMLRLLVSPEVHFSLEALPTQVAAEGLEARVFPAVCDQVGALAEGLPAHLALVRLLSLDDKSEEVCLDWITYIEISSDFNVFFSLPCSFEMIPTCVNEGVLLHVRLLVEPLSAVLARIGPRVRMDKQVSGERGGALKALATDFATEAPLLRNV